MRTHGGCDSEQGDCHESGNQQTLHAKLRWFDMQCGLHHCITANGHPRMWPASPITNLFSVVRACFTLTQKGACGHHDTPCGSWAPSAVLLPASRPGTLTWTSWPWRIASDAAATA